MTRVLRTDRRTIHAIAKRGIAELQALTSQGLTELDLQIMLTFCHASVRPLRLTHLLASEPLGFAHDILGLVRHLDVRARSLGDFELRYAAPKDRNAAARQRRFRTGRIATAMLSQGS